MKYSIITINYNNNIGLERTIESVLKQSFKEYEFIIIDGGSTDGSLDTIRKHEEHITNWCSEEDKGIYNAMNKGINRSNGDYCIFMNSGDCFHSKSALFSVKDFNEDIICGQVSTFPSGHHRSTITLVDLLRSSLPHQAMFIKRELLLKHPYDEKYRILSDWKFCLETIVINNCSFRNIETIISDYESNGISTNSRELFKQERESILKELFPSRILEDYERLIHVDDELLNLSLLLTQTITARKWVKCFSKFILSFTKQNKA